MYDHHQPDGPEAEARLDPWAEYAVLEVTSEHLELEFRRVPLAVDALIQAAHATGSPGSDRLARQYGWL